MPLFGRRTFNSSVYHAGPLGRARVESSKGLRVAVPTAVESSKGLRVKLPESTFYESFLQTPSDVEAVLKRSYAVRIILHDLDGIDHDVTSYLRDWTITQGRNVPATWTVKLNDVDRLFRPILTAEDEFFELLEGRCFDDTYALKRYWTIEVSSAGETWTSPHLIQLDYDWEIDADGTPVATIGGTDMSEMLLQDDEEMDDFVSVPGDVHTAHSILAAILERFGIDSYSFGFDDFPVYQKFSPKDGKPLDWIMDLLWVRQAEWYWDQDQFVAKARPLTTEGGAFDYEFVDVYHLKTLKYSRSVRELKNQFTIRKVSPFSGVLGTFHKEGAGAGGFVDVSLTPTRSARVRIEEAAPAVGAEVYGYVWYGEGGPETGAILAFGSPGFGSSGAPAYAVRFTYEPPVTTYEYTPLVRGYVSGTSAEEDAAPLGTKAAFTVMAKSASSQTKWGIRKDRGSAAADLIPDEATAEELAAALLNESLRSMNASVWDGVLFPFVTPSHVLKVTAGYAGILAFFLLESVTKSGDKDGARMNLTCTMMLDEVT